MDAQEKAREFLRFVGENEKRLRRNLAKNVTYDAEIFENAFQDTVVRVYDTIIRSNPDISDYEQYFFQASRKHYFTLSERARKKRDRESGISELGDAGESPETSKSASVNGVRDLLVAEFGETDTGLFMDYMGEKTIGRTSYRRYGMEFGVPSVSVKTAVVRIKKFLRNKYKRRPTAEELERDTCESISESIRLIKSIKARMEDGVDREEEEKQESPEKPV